MKESVTEASASYVVSYLLMPHTLNAVVAHVTGFQFLRT